MRLVVLAYQEMGAVGLETLLDAGEQVTAVFTHEDDPGEEIWFRSVRDLAGGRGIPVFTPPRINEPEWIEAIAGQRPDILFSFYYRKLLGPEILGIPRWGALNLHGSLLPRYRGRAPANWAIVNGETQTGVTLHHMVAEPDAGDIVAQRSVPIHFEDTALDLGRRLAASAARLLAETLPRLRTGAWPRTPQDHGQATRFPPRRPEDGRIDWSWPALRIHNLVRAVTHPYPGAFTTLAGRRLTLWQAYPLPSGPEPGRQGEVLEHDEERGLAFIQTGDGVLETRRIQVKGEPEQRGTDLPVGALLGGQEDSGSQQVRRTVRTGRR